MADDRQLSVGEIKRILKNTGKAFISLGASYPFGFVDEEEWGNILKQFKVERGGSYKEKWAVVSLKQA